MMPEATVTHDESVYRAKYYKGPTSVKNEDLYCSSCGNIISFDADNFNSHPVLGILQCQACCNQVCRLKSSLKVKSWKKRCLVCGSDQCQTLFPCPVKDCPYSFCKKCLKRNASSALILADTPRWKCFVCETNPLWKARGICATLLSASPRRRKKLKKSYAMSSEDDDIDDIKAQLASQQSSTQNARKSRTITTKSSNSRGKRALRNVSKSSQNQSEDSEDDLEVLSVIKSKKSSKPRSTRTSRRAQSSERSSVERSTTPESTIRRSRATTSQTSRKTRTGSTDSRKSFTKRLESIRRQNSDSSSGKEFTQTKLIRESYVPLQRLSIGEIDVDRSPEQSHSPVDMVLTKPQMFSLKTSVQEFIKNLKTTSKKMLETAESLQRQYAQRETIKPLEATKWIADCKNTTGLLKKRLNDSEHVLIDQFAKWCNKTKVKNIFIDANGIDDSVRQSRGDFEGIKRGKEVIPQFSSDGEGNVGEKMVSKGSSESIEKTPEVSDCESEEIFTQDEASVKGKESKMRRKMDKSLSPVDEEIDVEMSDEHRASSSLSRSLRSPEAVVVVVSGRKGMRKVSLDDSSNDMFADSESEGDKAKNNDKDLSDSGNISDEAASPGPKSSKKSQGKGRKSMNNSDDEGESRGRLSLSGKSLGGKNRKSQEKNRKARVSLVNSDASSSDDGGGKGKNRSLKLLDVSGDDEQLNRSKEIKRKRIKSSTPVGSDVDTSDVDKLAEPIDKNEETAKASLLQSSSSSEDECVENSNDETSEKKKSPLPEDEESLPSVVPSDDDDDDDTPKNSGEHDSTPDLCDAEQRAKQTLLESSSEVPEEEESVKSSGKSKLPLSPEVSDDKKSDNSFFTAEDSNQSEKKSSEKMDGSDDLSDDESKKFDKSYKKKFKKVYSKSSSEDETLNESVEQSEKKGESSGDVSDAEETLNESVDESGKKETFKETSDVEEKAKKDLLNSDSSLDVDEAVGFDESEKSEDKIGSDDEERAKKNLLNSTSSDDKRNKAEKRRSEIPIIEETTKDSLLESDTSLDKVTDEIAAEEREEEAKKNLLNSDSSSENDAPGGDDVGGSKSDESDDDDKNNKKKKLPVKRSVNDSDEGSEIFTSPRAKKRRLDIKNSEIYKSDKKLRMKCTVAVERLPNRILRRHARALKKSKEYLEDKAIKSLTSLDGIEKQRKRDRGNGSDSSDTTSTSRMRKKTSKEAEDTLLDHLNGEKMNTGDSSSDEDPETRRKSQLSGDLQQNAERLAKNNLLESSDDEKPIELSSDSESIKEDKKKSPKKPREKPPADDEGTSKSSKSDWKRSKLLAMKFSSSDEEEQSQRFEKKVKKLSQKDSDDSDLEKEGKKKKRIRRRRLNSDSDIKLTDEEPSDDSNDPEDSNKSDKKGKKRSKKVDNSSDSSSSTKRTRPKPKRRRVRTAGTDSDSDIEEIPNSQGSPNKSGRKNIRKVLKDKQVADDTKQAAKQEEERLKRMAERQKLYNEMYEARLAGEEKVDKLILDFDEESKEELLSVHEGLVKRLKPHQAQGIKFMWDACFESLERAKSTKGSGCILAHCMGLGKSFQAVTLTHTLLINSEKTGVETVLVVCPLSTVLNWVNEFKIWLAEVNDGDDVEVYELTRLKKNTERKFQLERWKKRGGVMIIGYEMYRNLSNPTKKVNKKLRESFVNCLVDPGPDLVICDEGHLLKSEKTAISKAMSNIKTLRRIVLTGTPLQNNLAEYHCMVQFVKPNLLGTRGEFLNRFVNPIQNGQFDNSTEYDVKLMKKRAHVLHKMLEGSVQRFDYSVLTPFLPPKQEYVIFVKLSDIQVKLYQYYIDNLARRHRGVGGSLFADFQALQRVWTHPIAIKLNADKTAEKRMHDASDSEGSLKDFIDDGSDDDSSKSDSTIASTSSSRSKKSEVKRCTRANPDVEEVAVEEPVVDHTEWWNQFIEDEHFEDMRISGKLRILFEILKECENIGDKVLVFSQSLYSLTLIERFLGMIDDETQRGGSSELIDGHTGSWSLGLDYFRLDGQTSTENRSHWCKIFNRPSNTRARLFLISTRAGGLGINLTAANRVVIFDASWNPSHDVQSIFRIYRFGQKKPCYVYRLLAAGTMEEKIYNRQVTKLSLSCRVVDEQQIERHYTNSDLAELYRFDPPSETTETIGCPKDRLLAEIFSRHKNCVNNFHEHDSLLENKADEELDEEERKQAWLEYEQEKAGRPAVNPMMNVGFNYQDQMLQQFNQQVMNTFSNGTNMQNELNNLQRLYQKDFPNMTIEQQKMMATKALMDMYSYMENQAIVNSRMVNAPMGNAAPSYPHPTNTLANQLAQAAYTKAHQPNKKMTDYQRQLLYAQRHGNLRNVAGTPMTAQNPMYGRQPAGMQQRATGSSDPDICEIMPSTATLNNTAPSSSAQSKPTKYQEE